MQDASVEMVRVEVIARIPKAHRRLGRAYPPLTRLRLGAKGEVPEWMLETYPLALRRLDPRDGSENPKLEPAEVTPPDPVEAAIDSSVAPKPPAKPIRVPRKRKAAAPKAATPPKAPTRRRKVASKE